eukprot:g23071.t1
MKCSERLVMAHINSCLPACLDPLQFAYRYNRSTRVLCLQHHYPLQTDLKTAKTEELIIEFRKKGGEQDPIDINGTEVDRVKRIKFLGVMITDDLSWTSHVDATVKKAQ